MIEHWLRIATRSVDALHQPRLSILIFHRVLRRPDPLQPWEPDADRFDRLCRVIAAGFDVRPLGASLKALRNGTLHRRALCITFDDGYADNAEVALPILQRYGLSATFFVATDFLDGGRMWNDTVIESIRRSSRDNLDLRGLGMDVHDICTTASRQDVIARVLGRLKYLGLDERDESVRDICSACGSPELPSDLMMRSRQLQQITQCGMEVGGHTVRHPILRALSDEVAMNEIVSGRSVLQTLTDTPVELFAYPNGRPGIDYDHRHVRMVQEAGFIGAVSTAPGVANTLSEQFELPRFTPWDHSLTKWMFRLLKSRLFAIENPMSVTA